MTNTVCLLDDNNIELLVTYDYERDRSYYAEPDNPATFVEATVLYKLRSVELVVAGKGIEITPMLSNAQVDHIIDKINDHQWSF